MEVIEVGRSEHTVTNSRQSGTRYALSAEAEVQHASTNRDCVLEFRPFPLLTKIARALGSRLGLPRPEKLIRAGLDVAR